MAVVSSWDGANRLIYLLSGVTTFHPIDDIYREYRTERANVEAFRVWEPFMVAIGNDPKGGGKFTARYLSLLDGVKIVPFDEANTITVTGEVLSEDLSEPFDYSGITNPVVVKYQPPDTELVEIVSGSGLSVEQDATLTAISRRTGERQRVWLDGTTVKMTTYEEDGVTEFETHILTTLTSGEPTVDPDSVAERGAPA